MKKWLLALTMGGLLIYIVLQVVSSNRYLLKMDLGSDSSVSMQTMNVPENQLYRGHLILVNRDRALHHLGLATDIIKVSDYPQKMKGYSTLSHDIMLSQHVLEKFQEMISVALLKDNYQFILTSGYRDREEQASLFKEKGSDYALPAGFSEHNIGLSVDIGSVSQKMEYAPEGKWLQENAWNYGFILRYPTDKTAITGIQYEPWHFRYVGVPHSLIMKEKNWVLEEYIKFLQENNEIKVSVGDRKYEIRYYPYSENMTIDVPMDRHYELSGDNVGGIIVCYEV